MSIDNFVLEQLNSFANSGGVAREIAKWSASELAFVLASSFVVGFTIELALAIRRRRIPFELIFVPIATILAAGIGLGANQGISSLWYRARPYDVLPSIHLLLSPSADPSFPSDHATAAFTLAFGAGLALPWLRNLLLAEASVLVIARVAVGMHYPTDIVGGVLVALGAVMVGEICVFRMRSTVYWLCERTVGKIAEVGPPPLALSRRGIALATVGVFSVVLGLPVVLEMAVDPIKLQPSWLEGLVLLAGWALLGLIALVVSRSALFPQARRSS